MRLIPILLMAPLLLPQEDEVRKLKRENESLRNEILILKERVSSLTKERDQTRQAPSPKARTGRVMGVADDVDLLMISIGIDDEVFLGEEFRIRAGRSGSGFACTMRIIHLDRKWSVGRILRRRKTPRVGDQAINVGAAPMKDETKDDDPWWKSFRDMVETVRYRWKEHGVIVDTMSRGLRRDLAVHRGVRVLRVKGGGKADRRGLMPDDLVPGVTEKDLMKALAEDDPIRVIRRGEKKTLK